MYRKGEYLKSGRFGVYRGKKYKLTSDMEGNRIIMTTDKKLADDTFEYDSVSGIYKKIIDNAELEYAYRLDIHALVDGEKIGVEKETEDEYLVCTGNSHNDIIEKYNLEWVDRGVYKGWISKEYVELLEERRELQYNPETKALEFKD